MCCPPKNNSIHWNFGHITMPQGTEDRVWFLCFTVHVFADSECPRRSVYPFKAHDVWNILESVSWNFFSGVLPELLMLWPLYFNQVLFSSLFPFFFPFFSLLSTDDSYILSSFLPWQSISWFLVRWPYFYAQSYSPMNRFTLWIIWTGDYCYLCSYMDIVSWECVCAFMCFVKKEYGRLFLLRFISIYFLLATALLDLAEGIVLSLF